MSLNSDISNDFPNDGKIYLNNASVSPMPLLSIIAMTDFMVTYCKLGPDSIESEPFVKEKLIKIRLAISKLINCQPEEIILTQSTTDGINIVSNGLRVTPQSNIIIRGESHEHHANYYPWLNLSSKLNIRNLKIDKNGLFEIGHLLDKIDDETKLVALSHALYNTGAILPVNEIGEILEKKNIPLFLDAAQTVGCIGDFDVRDTKCNFMAFNGSKWLCGPIGTGIFYCNRNSSELIEPTTIGGESAMIYDENKLAYKDIPEKFQTGFRNYVGIVGLESSINYLLKYGLENIHRKIMNLANLFRSELSSISGITLYGPDDSKMRNSIVSFTMDDHESRNVIELLEKQKIILAEREIMDKKIIRASPHFFNSDSEILKVVDVLKKL